MKKIMFGLLGAFLLLSFVSAQYLPDFVDHDVPILNPPVANPGGGHSRPCTTMWGWDGQHWIKRPVVKEIKMYHGKIITNYYRGEICRVLDKKPKMMGTVIDVSPLDSFPRGHSRG